MRFLLAGIFHLALASAVWAQANGDVESIGFAHSFRPGCWTPMVVRLTPTSGSPFKGKIAVYQDDADHDHAIFTRPISLAGNVEGGGDKTQRFWMYFIPQADLLKDGSNPDDLNRHLFVYLTTDDSPPKQITRLLIKDSIDALDSWESNLRPSKKLVLCVTDQSRPIFNPYAGNRNTLGLKEDVVPVMIPIGLVRSQLPENVLGYESVDAVAWFDADPGQLSTDQRNALEEYVRRGGKLIISQSARPNVWQMVKSGFGSWLPVDVQGIEQVPDLLGLKRIVEARAADGIGDAKNRPQWKDIAKGPFDIARAKVKPGAVVLETDSAVAGDGEPYVVRAPLGMGSVTWIAQDLGEFDLTGRASVAGTTAANEDYKWLYVWDRVFDWANASQPSLQAELKKQYWDEYSANSGEIYHFGRNFLAGMEFPGRGVAYLGLAVLFFIIYWIVAGPGSYLFLAAKKRAGMSWFAFALSALIATGITTVIVKLLLQGPAEVRHVSFVRQMAGEPTWVHSQFGLYIPRDGNQKVELKKTAKDSVSYVTAYPSITASDEGAPPQDYEVPVFDAKAVSFPYRSTLKKLQARWVGEMPMGVEGTAKISAANNTLLEGRFTNKTGRKLINIYFLYRPSLDAAAREKKGGQEGLDWIWYVPSWDAGSTLDTSAMFPQTKSFVGLGSEPGRGVIVKGTLTRPGESNFSWDSYWYNACKADHNFEDHVSAPINFPLMSLFDHLPASGFTKDFLARWELHRPLLRELDVSGSIGAGQLVILAESETGPLPVPIEVEGDAMAGEGITYYQFILPLDRSALIKPATQLTTKPTTKPVKKEQEVRSQKPEKITQRILPSGFCLLSPVS